MDRVVGHWHRLPRDVVVDPSLEKAQVQLDRSLSHLVWWKMSLLIAVMTLCVQHNPDHSLVLLFIKLQCKKVF